MRKVIAASVIALVIAPLLATPAAAYSTTWSRGQALSYASAGLKERYVYGGSTFRNNDRWDSDEGADCSGYAAKVWAVEHYTSSMTVYHPYSTASFYNGFSYEVFKDRRYPFYMRAWVYRSSAGGPGNHMGLFDQSNTDGTWTTLEARGASYGIVRYRRSLSTLISWNYKQTDRKNWGAG